METVRIPFQLMFRATNIHTYHSTGYLMAALCGLGNMDGLIDRVCVIQDQAVGVYGFIFHRGKAHPAHVPFIRLTIWI